MFIAKNEDLIILGAETREELESKLQFMVYTSIEETDIKYEMYNGSYLTPEEIAEKEEERINQLTMTSLDLIGVLQAAGLTLLQINEYLDAHLELKMQLTYCQNVYCGVVRQLLPITIGEVTITDEMIVAAFKAKSEQE